MDMEEKVRIERVIEAFADYIDNKKSVDIAYTRKDRYLYLISCTEPEEIKSGEWLCKQFLVDMEFEILAELNLEDDVLPEEYYPVLQRRVQPYMDKLEEYKYLMERYECK